MLTGDNPATGEPLGLRQRRRPRTGPRLRPHLLGAEVGLAHLGARRRAGRRPRSPPPTPPRSRPRSTTCSAKPAGPGAARAAREFVHGNGFLAAAYVHRSSRAGDPQLHTHVLIANATKGPDGRWTRLYHPAIYDHAKTASYIYEAHLRHELTRRLGVEWSEVRNGIADIDGFDPEHLRAFSTRRAEILEAAGAGCLGPRPPDRDPGDAQGQGPRPHRREPARELASQGRRRSASPARRSASASAASSPSATRSPRRGRAATVTAHASHFDRRDAIQAVADSLPSGAPAAEVEAARRRLPRLRRGAARSAASAKGPRFTTERIWELERAALADATEMTFRLDRAVGRRDRRLPRARLPAGDEGRPGGDGRGACSAAARA